MIALVEVSLTCIVFINFSMIMRAVASLTPVKITELGKPFLTEGRRFPLCYREPWGEVQQDILKLRAE